MLRNSLIDPAIADMDVDSFERITIHREILARKRMIREVFFDLYAKQAELDRRYFDGEAGLRVEIGAGSSMLKSVIPDVESTDIVYSPTLDCVADAMNLPYRDNSLRAIFGIHCFHHLDDPFKFLSELDRVCRPGGGAVLVEPYFGPVSSFIHKRLYPTEFFDKSGPLVRPPAGPMSGANQALSYIVFVRERQAFERSFPRLQVVHMEPLPNYIRYFVSGGINFRQLLPDATIPLLKAAESTLSFLSPLLAIHHVLVLRKKK
jgi:methyltransferase family protein